jgi:hypothetical protein
LHRGFKSFLESINIGGNRFFDLVDAQHENNRGPLPCF